MTTRKPEVVCHAVKAVGAPVTLKFIVREDVADEYMNTLSERHPVVSSSPLIHLSAYEALQAECETLRKDAERYRFAAKHLILAGGVERIGWLVAPLGKEQWDKCLDDTMAAGAVRWFEEMQAMKDDRDAFRSALETIAKYPSTRSDEIGYAGCRRIAREALDADRAREAQK